LTYDAIRQAYKEYGVTGQTGILDVRKFLEKEISPTIGSKIATLPQKTMGVIEDRLRGALFLDRVIKGDTFEQAAKQVIKCNEARNSVLYLDSA